MEEVMSIMSKLALGILGLSVVATLGVTGVSAEEVTRPVIVADLKAPQGVKPGDCKRSYATAMGQNPATAQAIWVATVNAQFGANWAHWVGAKNKAIVPQASGSGTQYQARAIPCFYHAVP
jgi:hypothetical protein